MASGSGGVKVVQGESKEVIGVKGSQGGSRGFKGSQGESRGTKGSQGEPRGANGSQYSCQFRQFITNSIFFNFDKNTDF